MVLGQGIELALARTLGALLGTAHELGMAPALVDRLGTAPCIALALALDMVDRLGMVLAPYIVLALGTELAQRNVPRCLIFIH